MVDLPPQPQAALAGRYKLERELGREQVEAAPVQQLPPAESEVEIVDDEVGLTDARGRHFLLTAGHLRLH